MAQGYVCDRCGAAIFEGEQTVLAVEMAGMHATSTNGRLDLCPKCAQAVSDIINRRLVTANTRSGAWLDESGKTDE